MKIILNFDVEGDLYKYIHSPYIWHKKIRFPEKTYYIYSNSKIRAIKNYLKWRIVNKIRYKKYASGKQGFINILEFLEKVKIPASLNLCGYFFLEEKEKIPLEMPWAIGKLKKDHYFWQDSIETFAKDLKNIKNKNIDFGIHGFIHESFPLESKNTQNLILKKSIQAAKNLKIKINSFVPPFNMAFNKNKNEILKNLRKNKIPILRVNGEDNFFYKFKHENKITKPTIRQGIRIVNLSGGLEGISSEKQIEELIKKIKNNYQKNSIFCIMAHDYTFKSNKNLFLFYKKIKELQKNYKIEFTNFSMI